MPIEVGQVAPDFELRNQFGTPVRLSSFRGGKNVLVVFFPKAFTATCTSELRELRDAGAQFENDGTVVLGISCDTEATLKVFAESERLEFALLSDFWPHGAVSSAYGVFLEERGFPVRGTFIVDRDGVVRWSVVNSPAEARRASDYREALAALATPAG
jgi:peroxiredoxin